MSSYMTRSTRRTLHVIGAGKVAGAIAHHLAKKNGAWRIGNIYGTSNSSITQGVARIGAGTGTTKWQSCLKPSSFTLIGLPDKDLASVSKRWAAELPDDCDAVALHLSGALSSREIGALKAKGVHVGSLHPAFSFADRSNNVPSLEGVTFSVEGDPKAVEAAGSIAVSVGGLVLKLSADNKALHHAASVMMSNYLVTLYDLAQRLEKQAGIPEARARNALLQLGRSTLENITRHGSPKALTGPIDRGDVKLVMAHLAAIEEGGKGIASVAPMYRRLGEATADVALAKGSISKVVADELVHELQSDLRNPPDAPDE